MQPAGAAAKASGPRLVDQIGFLVSQRQWLWLSERALISTSPGDVGSLPMHSAQFWFEKRVFHVGLFQSRVEDFSFFAIVVLWADVGWYAWISCGRKFHTMSKASFRFTDERYEEEFEMLRFHCVLAASEGAH